MDYIASFPIDCGVDAKHLRIMASMGGDFPHERLKDLHDVDDLFQTYFILYYNLRMHEKYAMLLKTFVKH